MSIFKSSLCFLMCKAISGLLGLKHTAVKLGKSLTKSFAYCLYNTSSLVTNLKVNFDLVNFLKKLFSLTFWKHGFCLNC